MDIMDVINSLEDMISTGGASAEEILQAEAETYEYIKQVMN